MVKKKAHGRDLRIDVFIGDAGSCYRVTHIPSGVFIESNSVAEAVETMNRGLDKS